MSGFHFPWRLVEYVCVSGRTKKKAAGGGAKSKRQKRRDFDTMYYMGVHNRSGGNPPVPS